MPNDFTPAWEHDLCPCDMGLLAACANLTADAGDCTYATPEQLKVAWESIPGYLTPMMQACEDDPADDLYREERAAARYDASDAAYEKAAERAWARDLWRDADPILHTGVVVAPVPQAPERKTFTARPRKVSWREMARDIYADLRAANDHKEAITRW